MKKLLGLGLLGIMITSLIITPVHATQTFNENPGNPFISLNSNSGGVNYLLHNAADNANLEFATNDNGTMHWQVLNVNKGGTVSVGTSAISGAKFQVNANSGWAGRFINTSSDIRIGYPGGYGIFMSPDPATNYYQIQIAHGSGVIKFQVNADGQTFIDNTLKAKQVIVTSNVWADYVFNKDYKLKTLNEVENYINKNGHLPGMESADDIKNSGLSLGDMQTKQMEKIEELTLYTIQQDKKINALESENKAMEARLERLEKLVGSK